MQRVRSLLCRILRRRRTTILNLPTELLLQILSYLVPVVADIYALLRTTKRFALLCTPVLIKVAATNEVRDRYNGRSVLHWAASNRQRTMLSLLLQENADPNATDLAGATPLHCAIFREDTGAVAILLSYGADTGIANRWGWRALHLAAIIGNPDVTMQLLATGADIGSMSAGVIPKTALHYAVLFRRGAVAKVLINEGADVEARDGIGITVLEMGLVQDCSEVTQVVSGSGPVNVDVPGELVMSVSPVVAGAIFSLAYLTRAERRAEKFRLAER